MELLNLLITISLALILIGMTILVLILMVWAGLAVYKIVKEELLEGRERWED